MTREKLKIVSGVPLQVTLSDMRAREMSSRFHDGIEYLYSVEHRGAGCLLYLPVEGHMALKYSGAVEGDDVQITKTHVNGSAPSFHVKRFSDATLTVPALPTIQDAPVRGVQMMAPRTQVAPAPAPPVPAQASGTAVLLSQCLHCAIDAALGAERFALAKGKELNFNEEDIRAMALSIFIGKQREGR
jgi:hypothetical protein